MELGGFNMFKILWCTEIRFTSGLNKAKNINYIKKWFKSKLVVNDCFFNEKYEYSQETRLSPKSRKIRIIFLSSSITSNLENDRIYPLAQCCQFSIFQSATLFEACIRQRAFSVANFQSSSLLHYSKCASVRECYNHCVPERARWTKRGMSF